MSTSTSTYSESEKQSTTDDTDGNPSTLRRNKPSRRDSSHTSKPPSPDTQDIEDVDLSRTEWDSEGNTQSGDRNAENHLFIGVENSETGDWVGSSSKKKTRKKPDFTFQRLPPETEDVCAYCGVHKVEYEITDRKTGSKLRKCMCCFHEMRESKAS